MSRRILVIAADAALRSTVAAGVVALGYDVADEGAADVAAVVIEFGPSGVPEGVTAPVVVLVTSDEEAHAALDAGAFDVLRAPVGVAELRGRLAAAVRLADTEAALRIDPLTHLASHPHIDEHLAMASSAARRHRQPLSLLMLDVDHLSRVNDVEGHRAGDAVLLEVARRVKRVLRGEDVAGRWTSDVIAVIAPATDLDGAWRLGERLRDAMVAPISLPNGNEIVVTVSVGCSTSDGDDIDGQIKRADAALRLAKSSGRNRVCTDAGL